MASAQEKNAVLLAASYPPREYRTKADSHEIAAAVKALAGAVFQRGWTLVFGGHPTISPLVLMIAREHGRKGRVVVYQSAYFRNHIGPATRALISEGYSVVEEIPNDPAERPPAAGEKLDPTRCPRSPRAMRESMVRHPGLAGLVQIAGDTGLRQELEFFAQRRKDLPAMAIGAPGGMAAELAREVPASDMAAALATSQNYLSLCSEVVRYLGTVKH